MSDEDEYDYLADSDDITRGYYMDKGSERPKEPRPMTVAKSILEPRFPGLVFDSAGGSVPFQATGTYLEAADFYFRFRHDSASLTIGKPQEHVPTGEYVTHKSPVMNEDYAGSLTNDEFTELFSELMEAMFIEHGLPRE